MRDGRHGNRIHTVLSELKTRNTMNNDTVNDSIGGTNGTDSSWEDILDDGMKVLIPKFWLKFKPPSLYVQYIMGTVYTVIMTAGCLGNLIIMWLFFTTKRLRKPSNYLVINLAFSDFLMIHKMIIFIYNSFKGGPAAGPFWCTYYGVMGGLSGTSAIMTIAMMSIERYICVSKPLDPSSRMTRPRALLIVCFIWAYSSVFSSMPLFGLNRYVPEGFLTSCSFDYLSNELQDRIFILSFFVAAWCVPMVIICRCYIGIVKCVSESQRMFINHAQSMQVSNRNVENQRRIEIKLAKISFALISTWTLSWTPYATVALLGMFSDRSMLTPFSSMLPALFCKLASVLDPFIYGLSNRQFKGELLKRLVSLCKAKKLQNRNVTSLIMRTMSLKSRELSLTDENAEVSSSSEGEPEMEFKGNLDASQTTKEQSNTAVESQKAEAPTQNLSGGLSCVTNLQKIISSELNNHVGLKRIHVFPIPHVYVIERYNDIIKLKSRRSF